MSDFTTGREIRDDLAPAPEVEHSAPIGGEVFGERMGLAPSSVPAVSAEREAVPLQISDGLTEAQKADLADAILSRMGDMHSHYDIDERNGGFALVRTFEMDDDSLREYGLPEEQQFRFADTLEEMREKIINRDGPFYIPELVRETPSPAPAVTAEREPMTLEAIERDPMNAIKLDLPADADRELLTLVATTADALHDQAIEHWLASRTDEEGFRLFDLIEAAGDRREEATAAARLLTNPTREPMTLELIERDPMNAITLDLPPAADKKLLDAVADATLNIRAEAREQVEAGRDDAGNSQLHLATVAKDRYEDALSQLDQIAEREAWQAPAFSRDTIDADPHTAVYLPVPAGADRELLEHARDWAADLQRYALNDGAFALPSGLVQMPEQAAEAAASRVADLDLRLERMREPAAELENARLTDALHDRAEVETRAPRGGSGILDGILDGYLFNDPLNKHMTHTAELIANVLIGYFVSEPELTPQQVHDLTRANAERDESRAVDLAAREADAGLVAANWDINHNRSPVPGGAGDEVRRGESVFDRYPGLTRDDSGAGEQERESDRAFYDTGIERER